MLIPAPVPYSSCEAKGSWSPLYHPGSAVTVGRDTSEPEAQFSLPSPSTWDCRDPACMITNTSLGWDPESMSRITAQC